MNPKSLVNVFQDTGKVGFQLFPEAARLFEWFLTNRADTSPDIDATKSFFAMLVVSIVIHPMPAFRTVRRNNSPEYAVCDVFEVVRVALEDWVEYTHMRKV